MDAASLTALREMVIGDALGAIAFKLQLLVLALMVCCAGWAAARRTATALIAFLACALLWSRANQALEGPVLLRLTSEHGITTADLWPGLLVLLVTASFVRARRTSAAPNG